MLADHQLQTALHLACPGGFDDDQVVLGGAVPSEAKTIPIRPPGGEWREWHEQTGKAHCHRGRGESASVKSIEKHMA